MGISLESAPTLALVFASACATANSIDAAAKIARTLLEPMASKLAQAQVHLHGRQLTAFWNISDMANHRLIGGYTQF
jgi:hypothetical protein